jgi:hypothetical protein
MADMGKKVKEAATKAAKDKCPWPRFSYPTSSVALRFAPLRHCEGASVVRA